MTGLQEVLDSGGALPARASRAEALAGLCEALRSPDPVLRDEQAYNILATWIPELDPQERHVLGDTMAARFRDPEIQARTFAPLILAEIISQGDYDPGWQSAFADWYPAETDLRGYDAERGWLHAVAHGADLLGALGRHPGAEPAPLLGLAAARLLAPAEYVFAHAEDDRLGLAVGRTLTRHELTAALTTGWLDPIAAALAAVRPGTLPAFVGNTTRTLRVVYLLADRGVRPRWDGGSPQLPRHRDILRERLAAVLAIAAPFTG